MNDEENNREMAVLKRVCNELGEHFDSVQIFVTRYDGEDKGTLFVNMGTGNWYARRGALQEWLDYQQEKTRIFTRKENE